MSLLILPALTQANHLAVLATFSPALLQARGLLDKWIVGYTEALTLIRDQEDGAMSLGIPLDTIHECDGTARKETPPETALPPSTRRAMAKLAHLLNPKMSPFQ